MGRLWGISDDKIAVLAIDFGFEMTATYLEQTLCLRVAELKARGVFDGGSFTWGWQCNGYPSGSINIHSINNTLRLSYIFSEEKVNQIIRVTHTPCNYGGKRPWMVCPGCGARVGVLSGLAKYFYCRNCYQLPYRTQLVCKADRYQERATKIKERLGIENAGSLGRRVFDFDRPKGMHRSTFHKLQAKANACLQSSVSLWMQKYPQEVEMYFGDILEN